MSNDKKTLLTWVEISKSALLRNIQTFRTLLTSKTILAPCIKANAYGHGFIETAKIIQKSTDWFSINSLDEAARLREADIKNPLCIMGYVPRSNLKEAVQLGCRLVVYNRETIQALAKITEKRGHKAYLHLKTETGTNRQGISPETVLEFARYIGRFPNLIIEGISTHFANIEDTKNHTYAEYQLKEFQKTIEQLQKAGIKIPLRHCANSAALLLFPYTHFTMVRPGIATYGLWPSVETKKEAEKKHGKKLTLHPALTWKTRIAQIKEIPKGSLVGYGCTYRTLRQTRLAILPIGYYDGYDRSFSNQSSVLIRGLRAPVRGRICMNIMMVDVTKIPGAQLEDEAVLLGKQGKEMISAEELAAFAGTINYEITTRINERIPRIKTS